MDNNQNAKIITVLVCVVVLLASCFTLLSQLKLKNEIERIKENKTQSEIVIDWAGEEKSDIIDYRENMAENTNVNNEANNNFNTSFAVENNENVGNGFIINKNSKKIHYSDCRSVAKISDNNKKAIGENELAAYLDNGYSFCSICSGN